MNANEELRKLLEERGLSCKTHYLHTSWCVGKKLYEAVDNLDGTLTVDNLTPEQAIAATLGRPIAKSHPYGYERDTGAYDCTRCECGCINDISATYCNDCGGEIEIDMNAEKEIYHCSRHLVFAEKHDDGSLEFCERRYIPEDAATLGGGNLTAKQVCEAIRENAWAETGSLLEFGDSSWQAIADELNATLGMGTCKVESMHGYTDAHTHTSWCVELSCHTLDAWEDSIPPSYCPICGRKVVDDG